MSEWRTTTIGAIADIFDGPHATPKRTDSGPWFLNIGSLIGGRLDLTESAHISEEDFATWTRRVTPMAGDILFSYETRLGQAALMPTGLRACLGRRMGLLRPHPGQVDSRCFLYAFLAPGFQEVIRQRRVHGATVDRIPLVEMPDWPIALPCLAQQQTIAAVLGALDDKIAVNQWIANTSNDLMKTLYERAIRQGVMTTLIGKAADVFDGPHATPNKTDSGPWFLSISSLKDGRLVLSESAHLSEPDFRRWTRRVVPLAGDILFSYETRLGEAALMPPSVQACLGRRMALLRPRNGEVGPRTLLQAFLNKSFQSLIGQRAIHGATVDRIPLTSLPSWPIDLPTDNTRQLEDVLSSIDDVASSRERENERLAELRDTLLPRLMSGEIRVRDAERILEDAT